MDYLEAILMPSHPEHAQMLAWRGPGFDPAHFDMDAANARLAHAFGFAGSEKGAPTIGTIGRASEQAASTVSTRSTRVASIEPAEDDSLRDFTIELAPLPTYPSLPQSPSTPPEPDTIEALLEEIRATLPDSLAESDDELMDLLATLGDQEMPQAPVDFLGLSPADMHRLLYFPLESPDIVVLPEILEDEPVAPVKEQTH